MSNRDQRESDRILDRVSREAEAGGGPHSVGRARQTASGDDRDGTDPIDALGTRIGRVLGVVIVVGLVAWLALTLARGG